MITNIKTAGWSTRGWVVFITSDNKYLCMDIGDMRDENKYNKDLYSWIANDLRVFTPAKIEGNSKMAVIRFTEENKMITAKVLDLPEGYEDKDCVFSEKEVLT